MTCVWRSQLGGGLRSLTSRRNAGPGVEQAWCVECADWAGQLELGVQGENEDTGEIQSGLRGAVLGII